MTPNVLFVTEQERRVILQALRMITDSSFSNCIESEVVEVLCYFIFKLQNMQIVEPANE